jgi:predicted AAA+ superfamily ATPase
VKEKFKGVDGKKYLFIDEVQEIQGWEKALSGFLTDNTADLYITGSNSRILSSDLATYITGRYVEFRMYTLTFSEFLKFRGVADPGKMEQEFGALEKISDSYPKLVLSLDKLPEYNRNGIQWQNLIDFLIKT